MQSDSIESSIDLGKTLIPDFPLWRSAKSVYQEEQNRLLVWARDSYLRPNFLFLCSGRPADGGRFRLMVRTGQQEGTALGCDEGSSFG